MCPPALAAPRCGNQIPRQRVCAACCVEIGRASCRVMSAPQTLQMDRSRISKTGSCSLHASWSTIQTRCVSSTQRLAGSASASLVVPAVSVVTGVAFEPASAALGGEAVALLAPPLRFWQAPGIGAALISLARLWFPRAPPCRRLSHRCSGSCRTASASSRRNRPPTRRACPLEGRA